MILFVNVLITDKPFFYIYDRGRLGWRDDKLDVFKYTLASYKVLPWEKVIIYCELDPVFKDRWNELQTFVADLFPNAQLFPFRNTNQTMWKKALTPVLEFPGDGLIWYTCNDDHPFVDYDMDTFNAIYRRMLELDKTHRHVACQFSTWPAAIQNFDTPNPVIGFPKVEVLEKQKEFFSFYSKDFYSIQIVNKNLLHAWWFEHDYGDTWLPRTDAGCNGVISPDDIVCLCPLREISAHQDGLSHMNVDLNSIPPLCIPPGFFDRDIKIQYCGTQRRPGYVHINPCIKNLAVVDPEGVDERWVLEDIPLFWRDRISSVEIEQKLDRHLLLANRNEAVLKKAGYMWQSSRTTLVELVQHALRRDSPEQPYPLLDAAESLARSNYVSEYRSPKSILTPAHSIILLDQPGSTTTAQAVTSLLHQNCDRSQYEVILVTADEVSIKKQIDKSVLAQVDSFITTNQFDNWEQLSYHKNIAFNAGALAARGKVVTFCDSLGIYPSDFVSSTMRAFESGNNAALKSKTLIYSTRRIHDTDAAPPEQKIPREYLSVRREDFIAVGGFDEDNSFLGESSGLSDLRSRLHNAGITAEPIDMLIWRVSDPFASLQAKIDTKVERFENTERGPQLLPLRENAEIKKLRSGETKRSLDITELLRDLSVSLRKLVHALWEAKGTEEFSRFVKQSEKCKSEIFQQTTSCLQRMFAGDPKNVVEELKQIASQYPLAELHNLIGLLYFGQNQHDAAKDSWAKAIQLDSANYNARAFYIELTKTNGTLDIPTTAASALLYPRSAYFAENLS